MRSTTARQLDRVAQALGEFDIHRSDTGDPLPHDLVAGHVVTEGDTGQNGRLGGGVIALDVGGRVPLGQAQRLSLGQNVGIVGPLLGHLGEDEVGGPVDDPHHPVDPFPGQRFSQGAHQGDGPGHRRLVQEVDTSLLGQGAQSHPFGRGQQSLVGRDNRLTGVESAADQLAGRVQPADELDHHVDGRVHHQSGGVGGDQFRGDVRSAGTAGVADGYAPDLEAGTALDGQFGAAVLHHAHQGGAHGAASEHSHPDSALGGWRRGHRATLPPVCRR